MSFESFVTRRYLRIKHQGKLVPLITILSTFGVALGVMVLLVVVGVMTGFQFELRNRIQGIEAHMHVMRYNEWMADYRQQMEKIEQVPGVSSASPFVFAQGMLQSSGSVLGVEIRGIDPRTSALGRKVTGLRNPDLAVDSPERGTYNIVLGKVIADKLGIQAGDDIMLMVGGMKEISLRRLPQMHRLKVVGTFDMGMYEYDAKMGFMNIHQLQRLIDVPDLATGIEIYLKDPDKVDQVTEAMSEHLGISYWIMNWKTRHRGLFAMLLVQKIMMYVILTLIILVAAFNVASALIMMVKEKTKEIAILKAMGAPHRSISKIFLFKGLAIGVAGVGAGLLVGLGLCAILERYQFIDLPGDVYFLTTLPVKISPLDMSIITIGTLLICTCASLYPAWQASRMNPVDAFRYG